MTELSEWFTLDPNDFSDCWWRKTNIVDKAIKHVDEDNVICYVIIQDGNMGGNFWYVVKWYINNRNRYSYIISESQWFFNKKLVDINAGDIISTIYNPYTSETTNCSFRAWNSPFAHEDQKKFIKILERM